ncbi:MAG: restriction endonuclease subunit S [Verrucomicrobia bacterium]|nr:restriction endonuclease subunit S [Verrucomicrobiota bacterium]
MSAKSETAASTGRKKVVSLDEVVDFNPRFGKDELADDSLVSFIPMKCVEEESGRFEPLGDRKVVEVRRSYTPFRDGDVIFAKVTPCMENGKAAVLKGLTNGVGFGSTEFFALRPKNGLEAHYLFHFILQSEFRRDAARNMTGAVGLRRVPKSWLEQQLIPLPEPDEQRRIVAEIEKQFTRLEAGVAALRRVQANLKRYRAAVLKAACEGRLVPTEAELQKSAARGRKAKASYETGEALLARILTERRKNWTGRGKYKEPAAPEAAKLPELLAGWTWATVEQLAAAEPNSITDGPFGSNLKTEHYMDSGPRVIRLQNIGDGVYVDEEAHISQSHFERLQKHRIFANDVVIAGFGENPPRSCIIPEALGPAIVKADCIRFKPHSSVLPKYMNIALNSDPVRKRTKGMVHGVGRPRLNLGEIKSIVLSIPPLAEQTRIVAEVERRLSVVEELEAVVFANLQRASRLRQAILQRAFSGELV